jgi:hypothetical protein
VLDGGGAQQVAQDVEWRHVVALGNVVHVHVGDDDGRQLGVIVAHTRGSIHFCVGRRVAGVGAAAAAVADVVAVVTAIFVAVIVVDSPGVWR